MKTMDNLSQAERDEYDAIRDHEEGLPCPEGRSEAYYQAYGWAYAAEQQQTARGLAHGN